MDDRDRIWEYAFIFEDTLIFAVFATKITPFQFVKVFIITEVKIK
ncbi:hypothetical protein NY78_4350 [Desulfovibrio sp. TomC]|nr:hypothetical protein NY78_4350 [Desulfovibrio sp. TomC]